MSRNKFFLQYIIFNIIIIIYYFDTVLESYNFPPLPIDGEFILSLPPPPPPPMLPGECGPS